MSRNQNSRFSTVPKVDISRSTFNRDSTIKTSFNAADVIPFYVDEVLPGDTFDITTSKVVRMPSLITPIMDNIYLDTYYFFVPNRLVWDHWKEFNGENTKSAWLPDVEYEVPQLKAPEGGWQVGTIADYMGIPTGIEGIQVNALPFRAYALIMNEWFRDQNLTDPLNIPTNDTAVDGVNTGNYITDTVLGGLPFKASKYRDYFTSCLPAPQKGPDVEIPVAEGGIYPVYATGDFHAKSDIPKDDGGHPYPLGYFASQNGSFVGSGDFAGELALNNDPSQRYTQNLTTMDADSQMLNLIPGNLWAISSGNAQAATINQLRLAFQVQKMYERDARGGTRYVEILKSHFGVTSPDARLQRPEYLGGNRLPITINQILQQSGTADGTTPQGTPTGQSLTTDRHSDFKKSFVEHGFVIGLMVARYDHTYQQGLERMWSRLSRFDYYWPVFANIGEQAVLNKEIYAQGTAQDDQVFGYQEAWAEYRYKPNRVSGMMRSQYAQSLDVWHLADDYDTLPSLSDSWIREDSGVIDRVIAVSQQNTNQLFADIYVQNRTTRPMPMYSVPGLIDHH